MTKPPRWNVCIFDADTGVMEETRLEPRDFVDQPFIDLLEVALQKSGKELVRWDIGHGGVLRLFTKPMKPRDTVEEGERFVLQDEEEDD